MPPLLIVSRLPFLSTLISFGGTNQCRGWLVGRPCLHATPRLSSPTLPSPSSSSSSSYSHDTCLWAFCYPPSYVGWQYPHFTEEETEASGVQSRASGSGSALGPGARCGLGFPAVLPLALEPGSGQGQASWGWSPCSQWPPSCASVGSVLPPIPWQSSPRVLLAQLSCHPWEATPE